LKPGKTEMIKFYVKALLKILAENG